MLSAGGFGKLMWRAVRGQRFRQSAVQNVDDDHRRDFDLGGFQVPVHDTTIVCRSRTRARPKFGRVVSEAGAEIATSTLSGNIGTASYGGAIINRGSLSLNSATLSGNQAGGLLNLWSVFARNTIIAKSSGPNCTGILALIATSKS
jgi:hypothetical protein